MKLTRRAALVAAATAAAFGLHAHAAGADLKVGVNVALSGPNSSLGIPYSKGMQAALAYKGEIGGHKIQLILLDDASDPAAAGRNARKLVDEDKVDVLMGSSGVPSSVATMLYQPFGYSGRLKVHVTRFPVASQTFSSGLPLSDDRYSE
jgi:branched-chain amino acid transport system substrate-binding protein